MAFFCLQSKIVWLFLNFRSIFPSVAKSAVVKKEFWGCIFQSALSELDEWASQTQSTLNENPTIEDYKTALEFHHLHSDVMHDIDSKEADFSYVGELGKKAIVSNPASKNEIEQILQDVGVMEQEMNSNAAEKDLALKYVAQLLELNKHISKALDDISRIEGALSQNSEVGNSLAEVETLLRRHEDLDHDINAVEDRSVALLEAGSKLVNEPPCNRLFIRRPLDSVTSQLVK